MRKFDVNNAITFFKLKFFNRRLNYAFLIEIILKRNCN